ncbi:MAG: cysteine--tRNA ligase, partial [Helicobacter sp.]|nr:cysteine--tRNA ligase [Helicobacter sp.]
SVVDEFIAKANESLDSKQKDKIHFIAGNLDVITRLLGVGKEDPVAYFQLGVSQEQKQNIEALLQDRLEAKSQKDFKKADSIREKLRAMGIEIMDTPSGSVWEKV